MVAAMAAGDLSVFHASIEYCQMRVIAVIPSGESPSSFIFVRRQVQSLLAMGLDIQPFFLKSRTRPIVILSEWLRLRRTIKQSSPDLVHAHYGAMTGFLCILVTLRPIAITFRGSDLNPEPGINVLRSRLGGVLSQITALRAQLILCTSSQLRDRLWWRKSATTIIPTGVNLSLFCPIGKELARRSLGWSLDKRIVLFNSGKNPRVKGAPLAARAVELAEREVGSIYFVQLHGEVSSEEMPFFLNAADCLVLSSESEGSPNIVKEAMACNLPVASVDVGDAAERLHGVYPSRVVPRDAAVLAQAIVEILRDGRRSNGREKITECSEERIAEKIRNAYVTSMRTECAGSPS